VEHYTFTGNVGVSFTGNALDNRISATIAADTVNGAEGSDTLLGAGGSDLLVGGEGDDSLDGGIGTDTLDGGAGNDIYFLDSPTEKIADSGGFDAVVVAFSIDLATSGFTGIEEVFLDEVGDLDVIGNAIANDIVGNTFDNDLLGLAGNDTLDGWVGNDSLDGGIGNDLLLGFEGDDTLIGNAGNDALAGEAGIDVLFGGAGADIYGYDPFADGPDVVHTGDNGVDHVLLFGDDLWDWDFDRIGTDLLITALADASDVYDESQTIRIVGQYSGTGIAYFEGDFGTDGNLFYGANPYLTRVYTPGTLTGKNQGASAELIVGTDANDKIAGNGGQSDWLFGGGGNDSIVGGSTPAGMAWLFGNAGNDTLGGGLGNNHLKGGAGDDLYIVDSVGDVVEELGSDADDELRTNQALAFVVTNVEHYTFTGATAVNFTADGAANRLTGTAKNDTLAGGAGDDTLNGGAGADSLAGGADDDTYVVDNAKDVVDEGGGDGTDKVQSTISYALAAGLENLELLGSAAINGTGNGDANDLVGNKAANKLDGKDGADTMEGNGGNDTYVVGEAGDQVIETLAGAVGGIDLVLSAISFDLSLAGREQVENLTLTGGPGDDTDATGNALANTLTGNAGSNKLDGRGGADKMAGGLGDDTYVVDLKTDVVTEGLNAGTDTVESALSYVLGANLENLLLLPGFGNIDGTGNAVDNLITGNEGSNRLDGKAGADHMLGHGGNDTYVIDNAGDFADETDGGGTDTIVTPFATILGIDFENLTLTGMGAVAGTGNDKANTIVGNGGANALSGEDNNDSLSGGASNDSLTGGSGNDTLDGGAGADGLAGGADDDTYVVDNAKDVVTEAADSGIDTVKSSVTLTLAANLENLTLTGAGAINGTGNELANAITGNTAANILSGGLGNDTLDGGKGNDKLAGGDGSDSFVRHSLAEGKDTIADFQTGLGRDVLDIADLLTGYTVGHEGEFVQCVTAGGNTTVRVDADGLANGAKFTDVCVLTGVTTDLTSLVNDGNILLT
jgi:Ca2+-binding RTX toxin-like protein